MSWYTWTTTIYYRSTVTSTTTITSTSTRPVTTSQYTTDIRDMQYAVFPGTIVAKTEVQLPHGTAYYKNYYNLAYIKVVDLWNTTNILAFAENGETRIDGQGRQTNRRSSRLHLRQDRGIHTAAATTRALR